jgi:DNA-binding NarL/FixJ family response regulator
LAEILPRCGPDSPISLFSGNSGADVILEEAARLGARGFVMTCSDALVTGRTDIVEGRSFEHAFSPPPARPAVAPKRARLNPGEHAVLGLFAAGLTRPAIAQRLVLAPETVHTHIRTASAKLAATSGVQTVAALVRSRGADMPAGFVTA